jgi:hypothetical protein
MNAGYSVVRSVFGTQGPEVRILSLRPFIFNSLASQSAVALRFKIVFTPTE